MAATNAFPAGFLWGCATAAHQVEGGNLLNDIAALESANPSIFREPAGDAVDHWNRFEDDMALLAGLGLNSYRFSIEWSRIEPCDGQFSAAALGHYQKWITHCLERGITPVVTLHHFTQPIWMARQGGMNSPIFVERFVRFCEYVVSNVHGLSLICTFNELNVPILVEHILKAALASDEGQDKLAAAEAALGSSLDSSFLFSRPDVLINTGLEAHRRARAAIKAIDPTIKVGLTLSIQDEQAVPGAESCRDARLDRYVTPFLDAIKGDDFVGVQNYTRTFSRPDGSAGPMDGAKLSVMGYEDRPEALAATCRYVWEQTGTPILVTENGWAGPTDARRCQFIETALHELQQAVIDGVKVEGYFYWSLLDNFEWVSGYAPQFGVIAVDRETQRRTLKPSAITLGQIALNNGVLVRTHDPLPDENIDSQIQEEGTRRSGVPLGID